MAITKSREFVETDRYVYDQLLFKKGFASIDTDQDASYYGTWACPIRRVLFSFAEGDCCTTECETDAEFKSEVERVCQWHREHGKLFGIDCGLRKQSRRVSEAFEALGLGDLLH